MQQTIKQNKVYREFCQWQKQQRKSVLNLYEYTNKETNSNVKRTISKEKKERIFIQEVIFDEVTRWPLLFKRIRNGLLWNKSQSELSLLHWSIF